MGSFIGRALAALCVNAAIAFVVYAAYRYFTDDRFQEVDYFILLGASLAHFWYSKRQPIAFRLSVALGSVLLNIWVFLAVAMAVFGQSL